MRNHMLVLSHTLIPKHPAARLPTITYCYIRTVARCQLTWYDTVWWPKPRSGFGQCRFRWGVIMALANKIKELRIKNAMSLQDLATKVGASKAHIWDLETGRAKNPTIELLVKLSNTLGTSVAELIGESADSDGDEPEVLAMFRDLKELSENDRETIKIMMERLKRRE
ncbi:helix-turn-helix transcriptional regulator [Sphingopyxis soli]